MRLRIDLAYDGTDFKGWAIQPGLRTVQGSVEAALRTVFRLSQRPKLTVAGRTDAGVHARGQVAHTDVDSAAWAAAARADPDAGPADYAKAVQARLNRLLPPDISIRAIGPAPGGFDARFSALDRRYSYRVCDEPALADLLRRRDTLVYPRPLDLERMNLAARACLGEHDFAAFCRPRVGASTIRELFRLDWAAQEPGHVVATVVADAFCHNMVRALAGALLVVGDGSKPPDWLAELLAARVRDPAARVAPPHPLCLEEVRYPPTDQLGEQARLTRRFRTDADQPAPG